MKKQTDVELGLGKRKFDCGTSMIVSDFPLTDAGGYRATRVICQDHEKSEANEET